MARDNNVYRISSDLQHATRLYHYNAAWQFDCLAQDSAGRLFAFASTDVTSPRSSHLIELDPVTGVVLSDTDISNVSPDGAILSAAFGPDDTLYGVNRIGVSSVQGQQFMKIDPETGNAHVLGEFSPSGLYIAGMDFDSHGVPYGCGTLNSQATGIVRIDLDTLALQDIFAEQDVVPPQWAIAFDSNDQLVSGGLGRITKIDMPSGELRQVVRGIGISFTGMEFIIPEPSAIALGSVAVIALAAFRRRK